MATNSNNPYAIWDKHDHSGPIIISTALCMMYYVIPGVLQQSLSVAQEIPFTIADGLFTSSMVSGVAQSSLVLAACHYGLGKSADHIAGAHNISTAKELYYASNILYIVTLGLVKCSASLYTANLTVKNLGSLWQIPARYKRMLGAVLGVTVAWIVSSISLLALPCGGGDELCLGTVERWEGILAGDAVTDVAVAAFAATIVWNTQATFRTRVLWYLPFFLRMLIPIWAGVRLLTISKQSFTVDPTISLWLFIILSQVQILFALIGGTSPALKKTLLVLVTNYGTVGESQTGTRAYYVGTYAMGYLPSKIKSSARSKAVATVPYSGGGGKHVASVVQGGTRRENVTSDGDSQEGIMRQDEFEISYSDAGERSRSRLSR